ncbi:MAG: YggS family pyridoxal phosphate-dependent enzyme [Gilvibacter sp.]
MSIAQNLTSIKENLPPQVTLVAVSKTKSASEIMEAYQAGQRVFGENKIQEMAGKWEALPKDIEWHMIGHVQRNKVKYMAEFVSLIHGVDSLKLLKEIDKQAKRHDRVIDCLIQVKIATEETKFGLEHEQLEGLFKQKEALGLNNVRIVGLMGMASFTANEEQIGIEFSNLKETYDCFNYFTDFDVLSMGMSGDYKLAIKHGSNMVRVGSAIFGERNYN